MKKPNKDAKPKPAYVLDEANEGLFAWGGRLADLRVPKPDHTGKSLKATRPVCNVDDGPLGTSIRFFEPLLFEKLCDEDAAVQGALRAARRSQYSESSLAKLQAQVTRVYEEEYLPDMIRRFDEVAGLISGYFAAKEAWRIILPQDFQTEEPVHELAAAPPRLPPRRRTRRRLGDGVDAPAAVAPPAAEGSGSPANPDGGPGGDRL